MALIKCPECGTMMQDNATYCPLCGCPVEEAKAAQPAQKLGNNDPKSPCPQCGAMGIAGSLCEYCGTVIPMPTNQIVKQKEDEELETNSVELDGWEVEPLGLPNENGNCRMKSLKGEGIYNYNSNQWIIYPNMHFASFIGHYCVTANNNIFGVLQILDISQGKKILENIEFNNFYPVGDGSRFVSYLIKNKEDKYELLFLDLLTQKKSSFPYSLESGDFDWCDALTFKDNYITLDQKKVFKYNFVVYDLKAKVEDKELTIDYIEFSPDMQAKIDKIEEEKERAKKQRERARKRRREEERMDELKNSLIRVTILLIFLSIILWIIFS